MANNLEDKKVELDQIIMQLSKKYGSAANWPPELRTRLATALREQKRLPARLESQRVRDRARRAAAQEEFQRTPDQPASITAKAAAAATTNPVLQGPQMLADLARGKSPLEERARQLEMVGSGFAHNLPSVRVGQEDPNESFGEQILDSVAPQVLRAPSDRNLTALEALGGRAAGFLGQNAPDFFAGGAGIVQDMGRLRKTLQGGAQAGAESGALEALFHAADRALLGDQSASKDLTDAELGTQILQATGMGFGIGGAMNYGVDVLGKMFRRWKSGGGAAPPRAPEAPQPPQPPEIPPANEPIDALARGVVQRGEQHRRGPSERVAEVRRRLKEGPPEPPPVVEPPPEPVPVAFQGLDALDEVTPVLPDAGAPIVPLAKRFQDHLLKLPQGDRKRIVLSTPRMKKFLDGVQKKLLELPDDTPLDQVRFKVTGKGKNARLRLIVPGENRARTIRSTKSDPMTREFMEDLAESFNDALHGTGRALDEVTPQIEPVSVEPPVEAEAPASPARRLRNRLLKDETGAIMLERPDNIFARFTPEEQVDLDRLMNEGLPIDRAIAEVDDATAMAEIARAAKAEVLGEGAPGEVPAHLMDEFDQVVAHKRRALKTGRRAARATARQWMEALAGGAITPAQLRAVLDDLEAGQVVGGHIHHVYQQVDAILERHGVNTGYGPGVYAAREAAVETALVYTRPRTADPAYRMGFDATMRQIADAMLLQADTATPAKSVSGIGQRLRRLLKDETGAVGNIAGDKTNPNAPMAERETLPGGRAGRGLKADIRPEISPELRDLALEKPVQQRVLEALDATEPEPGTPLAIVDTAIGIAGGIDEVDFDFAGGNLRVVGPDGTTIGNFPIDSPEGVAFLNRMEALAMRDAALADDVPNTAAEDLISIKEMGEQLNNFLKGDEGTLDARKAWQVVSRLWQRRPREAQKVARKMVPEAPGNEPWLRTPKSSAEMQFLSASGDMIDRVVEEKVNANGVAEGYSQKALTGELPAGTRKQLRANLGDEVLADAVIDQADVNTVKSFRFRMFNKHVLAFLGPHGQFVENLIRRWDQRAETTAARVRDKVGPLIDALSREEARTMDKVYEGKGTPAQRAVWQAVNELDQDLRTKAEKYGVASRALDSSEFGARPDLFDLSGAPVRAKTNPKFALRERLTGSLRKDYERVLAARYFKDNFAVIDEVRSHFRETVQNQVDQGELQLTQDEINRLDHIFEATTDLLLGRGDIGVKVLGQPLSPGALSFLTTVRTVTGAASLKNLILKQPGELVKLFSDTGPASTALGLATSFTKEGRARARRAGLVEGGVRNLQREMSDPNAQIDVGGRLQRIKKLALGAPRGVADLITRNLLLVPTSEAGIRTITGNTYLKYAERLAEQLARRNTPGGSRWIGTDDTTLRYNLAELVGYDKVDEAISRVKQGKKAFSPDDEDWIMRAGVERTQPTGVFGTPAAWQTPLGKQLFQFQSFALTQQEFLLNRVWKQAKRGNLAPAFWYVSAAMAVGIPMQAAIAGLYDRAQARDHARIMVNALTSVGSFGLYFDYAETLMRAGTGRGFAPGGVSRLLTTPGVALMDEALLATSAPVRVYASKTPERDMRQTRAGAAFSPMIKLAMTRGGGLPGALAYKELAANNPEFFGHRTREPAAVAEPFELGIQAAEGPAHVQVQRQIDEAYRQLSETKDITVQKKLRNRISKLRERKNALIGEGR